MSTTYVLFPRPTEEQPSICPLCSKTIQSGEPIYWPGGVDTHIECPGEEVVIQ